MVSLSYAVTGKVNVFPSDFQLKSDTLGRENHTPKTYNNNSKFAW